MLIDSGDDAALVRLDGAKILLKTDTVVAGVHFRKASPRLIGRKAMGKALSDIAAMGCYPAFALAAVALPRGADARGIYRGMESHGVRIVGGDVVATPGPLTITVSVVGETRGLTPVRRSGARPGDKILVTGPLGGWRFKRDFIPRVKEGIALNRKFTVHAMIDITDGLARDLGHLCRASGVGAKLDLKSIPLLRGATLDNALHDGEDFELLLTAAETRRMPATVIGEITGGAMEFDDRGYEHRF